jgi:hypothetical protein
MKGAAASIAVALAAASACSRSDAPPAAPAREPALPSTAEWKVECRPVRDDRHQACYGPGWDAHRAREPGRFHFYQVSVERKQSPDTSHVLFVKRLAAGDVHGKLLQDADAGEVVRYDAKSRTVRFDVSPEPIVFVLERAR